MVDKTTLEEEAFDLLGRVGDRIVELHVRAQRDFDGNLENLAASIPEELAIKWLGPRVAGALTG